ncbi:uncharacterized protein Dwil_GK13097 [Drosophila willistoni]|uniref:Methionyl-tRNA formyltransferase, mitochondrial n=1 Tax=Drosophila willistoni TaxID=7260 RepID=B4NH19_DROWI|nr:methionyl-tRNA formyltransferase, mitochondrial [Drosophila willistoni]EDW84516.1 uncharacterized protein Dwil_GK13097 [Drosophila willistoni]
MFYSKSLANSLFKYKRKVLTHVWPSVKRFESTCPPPKILFFGTDHFSLPSLKALHKNGSHQLGVVTSFKSPANCVRVFAEQANLPLQSWPIETSHCLDYDLGVVVSFGHLIPVHLIQAFPKGMINVHASLLPLWRGAAPIIYAIMNKDAQTGVSIMKIEPHHFDIGAILAQREMAIKSDILMPELHEKLAHLGADLLVDTVNNLQQRLANARLQDNKNSSYAPKITNKIAEVSWAALNAEDIYTRYRALYGFKNLTTSFHGKQIQLIELRLPKKQDERVQLKPGCLSYQRPLKSLLIGCANNSQVEVLQLRVEGRKCMSAQDFNNGFLRQTKSLQFMENKQIAC